MSAVCKQPLEPQAAPSAQKGSTGLSISVVIPTYNMASLITQALDSVLAQTLAPREVIVVDDGSTDDTPRRLEAYRGRITYIRQENQGCAAARNTGVGAASGELVAFLDSDDIWHPRKLEMQRKALEQRPEAAVVGTGRFELPVADFPQVGQVMPAVAECAWEQLVVRTMFAPSSVLVRREVLQAVGGFDPQLRSSEDRDMWCRLAERAEVVVLRLPLTGMRDTRDSLSKNTALLRVNGRKRLGKLDAAGAWRGRWLFRREAYSCHFLSCCFNYDNQGERGRALGMLLWSLWWYPLPYRVRDVSTPLLRLKMLGVLCLRLLHLKPAPPPPSHPVEPLAG